MGTATDYARNTVTSSSTSSSASSSPPVAAGPVPRREYSKSRRTRRSGSHGRLRLFYFSAAALWSFFLGAALPAVGLAIEGRPFHWSPSVLLVLAVGVVLALLGAVLAAGAYREARRRLR